jgi:hypothetical protein
MDKNKVFSAMQGDEKPYSSYIKTVISRVYVSILDPFDESASGVILYGDPKKGAESSIVDAWTEKQDRYIKKMNKPVFDDGLLIKYERPAELIVERQIEEFSDKELLEIVNSHWFSLVKVVGEITSLPVLFRMLELAREAEKSEKVTGLLESKISEIQLNE